LEEAACVAIAREERAESPRGEWRERLWYPADDERRSCCETITPTDSNRQALESHCRTQGHVAHLFDVPLRELRRAVKRAREAPERALAPRLRGISSPGGRADALFAVSSGAQSDALLELRAEARSFQSLLPRLVTAGETAEDLPELLDEAAESIERLSLAVEYCRRIDATVDAVQSVRDLVTRFLEQEKKSA
jgi:hypothetical protein